ncbi:MAG TPA: prolyl oligopeptidase family serine peptidase [Chthoniobacterales bacterium]|jgi:prolyl oligopeptidase|nr:prolyl oligopeptidase family serine peptidase [Chthoniobacterales bacterium]
MKINRFLFPVSAACVLRLINLSAAEPSSPQTPKKPITDEYQGVKVEDNYQWLEKDDDPEVKAWSDTQNKRTRAYIDKLPDRAAVEKQLTEWYAKTSPSYSELVARPGVLFAMKFQPPKQQQMLVTLASADNLKSEKMVLDPNALDVKGTTAIDWFAPSRDGKYVAISISQGGSEDGTLHIYETATGKAMPDSIAHVQYPTAGGSAAWNADGTGIYYTRFPRKGERPDADLNFYQQIYFHKLGTADTEDTYSLGKDFPRIAEIKLEASRDGKFILATVANGDGGDFAHYLLGPDGSWKQITQFSDQIKAAHLGRDNALYLLSRADAPRGKILRLPLDNPELANATVIVPPGDAVIQFMEPTASALYVGDLLGGPSQIRRFGLDGKNETLIPIPKISAVSEMESLEDNSLLFRDVSYTEPAAWFKIASGKTEPVKTALVNTSPVSFADIEVTREFATSKGDTEVPLNIVRRKGTKPDGSNPTLLYGYGGYGISMTPSFDFTRRLWFDRGGVYVVANIRGGGEFGEDWHKAGNLTKKQNVFDDFAAAAEYLIKQKWTRPEKLALLGGSNGGLLMGAMITQHPDLMRAVVSAVGIYDMLRVELAPNGAFNVTEFGTVKNPEQFKALYAYSPYHNVVDDTKYPSILMMTGANDGRVAPYHSRKMVARLDEANKSSNPILLRTSSSVGHGIGTALSERIKQLSDQYSFLFAQLDMHAKK